jgi:hypothetical protein
MTREELEARLKERRSKESPEERERVLKALREDRESNRPNISIDEDSDPAQIRATIEKFMKK